jgi:hypothetical protein
MTTKAEHNRKMMTDSDEPDVCDEVSEATLNALLRDLRKLWFINFKDDNGAAPLDADCDKELIAMIGIIRKFDESRAGYLEQAIIDLKKSLNDCADTAESGLDMYK